MIMFARFSFAPDILIRIAEHYSRDNGTFIIVFSLVTAHIDDNLPKLILQAMDDKDITVELFHDDGKGIKWDYCFIKRLSVNVDAVDTIDITVLVSGYETEDFYDLVDIKDQLAVTQRLLTSSDCRLKIDYDDGDFLPQNRIFNFGFFVDREDRILRGSLKAFNSFLGDDENSSIIKKIQKHNGNLVNVKFGYEWNDIGPEWIIDTDTNAFNIARRELKQGSDRIEVTFEGSR